MKASTKVIAAILLRSLISNYIRKLFIILLTIILILIMYLIRCLNVSVDIMKFDYTPIMGRLCDYTIEESEVNFMAWHAKPTGGYSIYSNEGIENAFMIRNQLRSYGWTDNAAAAVVGNICSEGGLNPWRWQSDIIVGPEDFWERTHGYGLAGFTPAGKYIEDTDAQGYAGYAPNYLNHTGNATDGAAQVQFIAENPQYYQTHTAYPMTFTEFASSTASPSYLSDVWLYNFEQPAHPEDTQQYRRDCSDYFYNLFTGSPYISDDDIIPCLIAAKVIK